MEVDSGLFRWKGWKPERTMSEEEPVNQEYDVIKQPFLLENIHLQIRKVLNNFMFSLIVLWMSMKSHFSLKAMQDKRRLHISIGSN